MQNQVDLFEPCHQSFGWTEEASVSKDGSHRAQGLLQNCSEILRNKLPLSVTRMRRAASSANSSSNSAPTKARFSSLVASSVRSGSRLLTRAPTQPRLGRREGLSLRKRVRAIELDEVGSGDGAETLEALGLLLKQHDFLSSTRSYRLDESSA